MQKNLIANRDMTYATRRLKAGDPFQASDSDARILVKLGRASEVPAALAKAAGFKVPPPPVAPAQQQQSTPAPTVADNGDDDDGLEENPLKAVRDEYEQIVGKRPFHGWDEAELRRRMAEHQSGKNGDD